MHEGNRSLHENVKEAMCYNGITITSKG